eukprot:CAMPEP_0168672296 /NCGR_PEP_ID=MMETSP0503-20121227/22559_1 /TAXON_ID=89963 /ORGANISM="Heterocapsa rotundata, Strain SCCAP K-0483" /LENGTH=260 /DNA_ID=CAMNT_0008716613 /DNA_START=30 /DNA_END=812 /DNA_ORIENTATION=-
MTYAPPRRSMPPSPKDANLGGASAALALEILECDPQDLLSRPLGGRRSAAKLARERYEQALRAAMKAPADLLDFDSPPAAASSAAPAFDPDPFGADPLAASGSAASSPSRPQGGAPSGLWPGDTVMARYGRGGSFYRARVIRVYSRDGSTLADVEWVRPQAGARGDREYLRNGDGHMDETLHRYELQVGTDIRRIPGSSPGSGGGCPAAATPPMAVVPAMPPPPGRTTPAVGAAAVPDLLDLDDGPPVEALPADALADLL